MTREELLALCRKTPDVGQAKHEDFVDYILVLEHHRRTERGRERVENAYMAVDGKIAMANLDHRLQAKRLDFENPVVLVDNEDQLTLMVFVVSEIYGRRHGIATSRKRTGSSVERSNPWEVAETSAIGRALSAMGYGALPGAGLASADDMLRALAEEEMPRRRRARRLSQPQMQELMRLYGELYQVEDTPAEEGLNNLFRATFNIDMSKATYRQGTQIIAKLMAQRGEKSQSEKG